MARLSTRELPQRLPLARLTKALTAVTDPATGNVVCGVNVDADVTNDDPSCVPYNIWQTGGVTPAAVELRFGAGLPGGIDQGGDPERRHHWRSRQARREDAVGERRPGRRHSAPSTGDEESELRADQSFQTGDLLGQGAPTLTTPGCLRRVGVVRRSTAADRQGRKGAEALSRRPATATRTTASASTPTRTSSALTGPRARHSPARQFSARRARAEYSGAVPAAAGPARWQQ